MRLKTHKIVVAAMMAALTCVLTMVVKIPSPFKGYLNIGDAAVLAIGWLLSPGYGFLAAGLGSALADAVYGYFVYVPATFLIKGTMAVIVCYSFKTLRFKKFGIRSGVVGGILAEIVMVLGYYLFESVLYGFISSAVNIPANSMQGAAGLILGIALIKLLDKCKVKPY